MIVVIGSRSIRDLERRDVRVRIFWQISMLVWFRLTYRMTELGVLTQVGRSIFLGVSHAHIPRERGPTVPQIFRDLPHQKNGLAKKFGTMTCTWESSVFYGVSHAPLSPKGRNPSVPEIFGT